MRPSALLGVLLISVLFGASSLSADATVDAHNAVAIELCSSSQVCSSSSSYIAATGKRLVIEAVSGWCVPEYPQAQWVGLRARLNGQNYTHVFGGPRGESSIFHEQTRIYADSVALVIDTNASPCGVTLSGQLVDYP